MPRLIAEEYELVIGSPAGIEFLQNALRLGQRPKATDREQKVRRQKEIRNRDVGARFRKIIAIRNVKTELVIRLTLKGKGFDVADEFRIAPCEIAIIRQPALFQCMRNTVEDSPISVLRPVALIRA